MSRLPNHVLLPLIIACALFMENLDSTVLATALPAIASSFGAHPLRLNLAITAYLFSLAVFIPISGWMADRFGARRIFTSAIAVFTLGSIACGVSGALWELVLARILQGLGGAMMVPVGRLVLLRSVPKAQFVRAMSYLTIPALIGPIVGPPVGGFLTTYASWRWIFWINVPIGLLGIALALIFIDDLKEGEAPPLDVFGFVLAAVGLTGLVFGFEAVGRSILPDAVVATLLAVGALAALLYLRHARRTAHPVIRLSLLRYPTLRASVAGGFLFRIGIGAVPFLLPLMFQIAFGLSAFRSGMLTFVAAIGAVTMKIAAVPILRWFGFRSVLIGSVLLSGAVLAANGLFRPDTPHAVILAILLLGGFIRSLQFTSVNIIGYADIPRPEMSQATSLVSMAQQLSLSIGVGVGAFVLHLTAGGATRLTALDFMPAFFTIGAIAMLPALVYRRLPADAGREVSGHQRATPLPAETPALRAGE
ncbi:MAG: MFS transporter [Alphaproteobacteria bacterium]